MRLLILLAAAAVTVGAEDTTELRLLAGGYPGYREVAYHSADERTLALDDHRGGAISAEAVLRYRNDSPFHPWLLAGGAIRFTDAADPTGSEHHVAAYAGLLGIGLGAQAGPLILEAGAVAGLGEAAISDERIDATAAGDSSYYLSGELRLGAWLAIDRALLGVVGGWAAHRAFAEFSDEEDGDSPWMDSAYAGDGAFLMVGVGVRL